MAGLLIVRALDPGAELADYLALRNQPTTTPLTADEWWEQERREPATRTSLRLVGERGGRIVAMAEAREAQMIRDALMVRLVVDRAERARGLGGELAAVVEQRLAELPAASLVTSVRDDDPASRAWAERRGFAAFDHTFESRLDLERFDPAPHRWAQERAAAAGLVIEPCADADELYRLALAVHPDIPAVDLDPLSRDEFQRSSIDPPGSFSLVARAGGVAVGLAMVEPAGADGAWNGLTGVIRDHRGRGLARALKVGAAEEARRRGRRWLATHNNAANAPMLAVNEALGYVRQAGLVWLRRPGKPHPR